MASVHRTKAKVWFEGIYKGQRIKFGSPENGAKFFRKMEPNNLHTKSSRPRSHQ